VRGGRLHQARDGLELLRAELRGELPPPPIDQLTGMRLAGAEHGRVGFTLPASPWLRNEWGTVYGGVLTFLAKSAAAAAVQSTADLGTGCTALDIKGQLPARSARRRPRAASDRHRTAPRQTAGDRDRRGAARR
jgi:acyl-coenzyme A thioesterase PaaI-like protein